MNLSIGWLPFFLLAWISLVACGAEHEIRVRQTAGGPRLFVDGKVRPPEMLSLREGTQTILLSKERTEHVLTFSSHGNLSRTQVHIHFKRPKKSGWVRFHDFSVCEVGGKPFDGFSDAFRDDAHFKACWNTWPPEPATGCQQEFLSGEFVQRITGSEDAPTRGIPALTSRFMDFQRGHRYEICFSACAEEVTAIQVDLHTVDQTGRESPHHSLGPVDTTTEQVRLAAQAGVDFVTYMFVDWRKESGADFSFLDGVSDKILAANPDALLIPRFNVNAPDWWLKKHPSELAQVEPKIPNARLAASVSSERYRRDACGWIREIAEHMRNRYPGNFAGLQINGLQTDEWFYFDSVSAAVGREPAAEAQFGEKIPSLEELRERAEGDVIVKGEGAEKVFRFNRFLQERLATFMAELARTAREATESSKLVIMFYGYTFEHSCQPTGSANTGHYGVGLLLEKSAGAIDMISAPVAYGNRGLCGMSSPMGVPDTLARNGVLPISENDTRTPLDELTSRALPDFSSAHNVILREIAQDAIRSGGFWFFDLEGRGWWQSSELWKPLARYKGFRDRILGAEGPYIPDVAIVVGEESVWMLATGTDCRRLMLPEVGNSRLVPPKAGLSFGQYLLSDAVRRPLGSRVQLFPVAWRLSDVQLDRLVAQRREIPAVRAWGWAAGLYDEKGNKDISRMERLTGFKVRMFSRSPDDLTPNDRFTVEESPDVEVWERQKDGTPVVAVRKDGNGWSVFCGMPRFDDSKFLHRLAVLAGCRPLLKEVDIGKVSTWRRGGCCLVQAQEDGAVDLHLPDDAVRTIELRKGDVRLLNLD